MKRAVLTLINRTFCAHLSDRLPPSGRPVLVIFEARANTIIDAMPAGSGPDVGTYETLDAAKLAAGLEWMFATVADAYAQDDWAKIACQSLRLHALAAVPDILRRIAAPSKTLDGSAHKALPTTPEVSP